MNDQTATIGHNKPPLARDIAAEREDFAVATTAFLEEEYAGQPKIVQALIDEARALMRDENGALRQIADDETKGKVASLIKRMRDAAKAILAFHGKEKQPYLRGGQAVDQFFFGLADKLAKREKRNKDGAADALNQMLTDYDNRKLAEQLAEQRRVREEAERREREAANRRREEQRKADEARAAAERARKPENVAQHASTASAAEAKADAAAAEAAVAAAKAEEARINEMRKPADLMRNRGGDGTLTTVGQEKYAEVEDRTKLDKEMLWPYLPIDAIERALTQYAKATDYNAQMAGARIGRRNKSLVR